MFAFVFLPEFYRSLRQLRLAYPAPKDPRRNQVRPHVDGQEPLPVVYHKTQTKIRAVVFLRHSEGNAGVFKLHRCTDFNGWQKIKSFVFQRRIFSEYMHCRRANPAGHPGAIAPEITFAGRQSTRRREKRNVGSTPSCAILHIVCLLPVWFGWPHSIRPRG